MSDPYCPDCKNASGGCPLHDGCGIYIYRPDGSVFFCPGWGYSSACFPEHSLPEVHMSSTSRGGKRSPADQYQTPKWAIRVLFENMDLPCPPGNDRWLEPAAGTGNIIEVANKFNKKINWTGIEIDPKFTRRFACQKWLVGDYLTLPAPAQPYDVIITNPPFSLAMEFAKKALREIDGEVGGKLILLQRLNWLGTEKRNEWFRSNPPDIYVIPDRIPFIPSTGFESKSGNTTDSVEYAWFVWSCYPRHLGRGNYYLLPTTPLDQRCRDV